MKRHWLALACLGLGANLSLGALAHAETTEYLVAASNFMSQTASPASTAAGRTLEWDPRKGRWGLKLGVDPRSDRETQFRDMAPGVFYKLSPRLHIGGDVTLAPDNITGSPNQHLIDPQAPNPRVRLETTFKF